MRNSKDQISKIDQLISTISQARKSLADWHEQKTEALIQLDSLTYDVELIRDEKNRAEETNAVLRNEIETNSKIYQAHVEALMDQIQTTRTEKDEVQRELGNAMMRIDALERDAEEKAIADAKIEANQRIRVAEARSEVEIRMADETQRLKGQIADLVTQVQLIQSEKHEAEARNMGLEKELNGIRGHMLNALRNTADIPQAAAAPAQSSARTTKAAPVIYSDASKVVRDSNGDVETVEAFLKRFGY